MTTAVQHRRGTTAEHSTFTGLEGEVTIDTTKDTAVIHDGSLAGGYPLAKETLANVNPSTLSAITGAATASDDLFLMYDTSALAMKKMTRAELNNAITIEALDTVDINGGTIDGTTIGGTTPAAGAFTTLSASGSVTLSGGTANGVAYLNGSKVLTTGSALTFDGSALSVPRLLQSGSGTYGVFNSSGAGNAWASYQYASSEIGEIGQGSGIISGGSNTDFGIRATNNLVFAISYNEQMRLTSTGLGIGTSSVPSYAGYNTLAINGTSGGEIDFLDGGTTRGQIYSTSSCMVFTTLGAIPLYLGTNATTKATLDSSGNLGLGVTPSAVDNNYRALQVGHAAFLYSGNNQFNSYAELAANTIFDALSTAQYKNTGFATRYQQNQGQHNWYTAPSGTAGNAISFTQDMTLTSTGLGIGTSSPGAKLDVVGGSIRVNEDSVGTKIITVRSDFAGLGPAINVTTSHPLLFLTANTERARITSDGYLRMASGTGGIQFNGDTAAANALDDYEEGTFTPTIVGTTIAGVGIYSTQVGRYTKIGNRVVYSVSLVWSAHTGTGDIQVDGLPFTANTTANNQPPAAVWVNSLTYTANAQITALVNNNSNDILLRQISSGTSSAIPMDTSASFFISGHYEV